LKLGLNEGDHSIAKAAQKQLQQTELVNKYDIEIYTSLGFLLLLTKAWSRHCVMDWPPLVLKLVAFVPALRVFLRGSP